MAVGEQMLEAAAQVCCTAQPALLLHALWHAGAASPAAATYLPLALLPRMLAHGRVTGTLR